MKYTKEEYIKEYNLFHNYKYDYSLIDVNDVKIKIICPAHGIFEQNKSSHKKYGCWKCSVINRSLSQSMGRDKFIKESIRIHKIKYDYTLVSYKNYQSKVIIICKNHGEFLQTPGSHLNGNGCPKCGTESMSLKQKHSIEDFIKESNKFHDYKYDYSLANYINNRSLLEIICRNHGIFKQIASNHLSGQGCPKCAGKKLTNNEILEKCKKIHKNKYDYSKSDFSIYDRKIIIICKKHGEFKQMINNHLNQKQGCPKCIGLNKTTEDFIEESIKIHGLIYDYSMVKYKLAKDKVSIICKKHGEFKQSPTHHLSGQGCKKCKCSKGEKIINDILLLNNIKYIHHYTFNNFSNHEFDFYLPEKNICIEYDGVQHFKPVPYFGGEKSFINQQIRDKEKDKYCAENNIKLIRISYIENDIEKILLDGTE